MDPDRTLKAELEQSLAECERLRQENAELRSRLGDREPGVLRSPESSSATHLESIDKSVQVRADSRPELKISLFKSLFRGRDDVYAVRWKGQNGRTRIRAGGNSRMEPRWRGIGAEQKASRQIHSTIPPDGRSDSRSSFGQANNRSLSAAC